MVEAYVVVDGGHFTTRALAFIYLAGAILLFAIGVWIVVPLKELLGWANPLDDVVKFIGVTHMHPIKIVVFSSVIWLFSFWRVWQKGIFISAIKELKKH